MYIVHLGLAGGHHHVDLGAALRAAVVVLSAEGEGAGVSPLQVQHLDRIPGVKTSRGCFIVLFPVIIYRVNEILIGEIG